MYDLCNLRRFSSRVENFPFKINTVRRAADRPSLRFEGLGWYNSEDCKSHPSLSDIKMRLRKPN